MDFGAPADFGRECELKVCCTLGNFKEELSSCCCLVAALVLGNDCGRRPSPDGCDGGSALLVGDGVKMPLCRLLASAARAAAVSLRDVDIETSTTLVGILYEWTRAAQCPSCALQ